MSQVEVTEMEVRVDPMVILQCCLEGDDGTNIENDEEKISDKDIHSDNDPRVLSESMSESENCGTNLKQHSCSLCPKSFTSELTLQNHVWNHSSYPKRIYNNFNAIQEIIPMVQFEIENQNERSDSSSNGQDEGDESDYVDIGEEDLNNKFSCPICGKMISTKGNLKVHLETHRPKGRYGCDICGRM